MWSTKQYFINRDPVLSFSISVKNFTETRSPYHAGGNSTIPYPRIFKVRVKMYLTSHCAFAWDCSCSFNPKKKRIFPLIRFPLILSKPFSSERNGPRIWVPHVELPPTPSKLITISVLPSNTLFDIGDRQTHRQTYLLLQDPPLSRGNTNWPQIRTPHGRLPLVNAYSENHQLY